MKVKEKELYTPIKSFLEKKGAKVRGEVKNCDIAYILNDNLNIIELKNKFSLNLIYQALERKKSSDFVFIAIPRPKNCKSKNYKNMIKIIKSLEIGLITVALDSPLKLVEVIYTPKVKNKISSLKKRNSLLKELKSRNKDFNTGGSSKNDLIITSYRENSIQIACFLKYLKKSSPKKLINFGCSEKTGEILRNNHYSWFTKISRGIYELSDCGKQIFLEDDFKNVIDYYEMEIKKCLKLKEMKNAGATVVKNTNIATKK